MRLHRIYTRSTRHLHRIDTFLPRVQRWSGCSCRRGRTGPGLQPRRSGHCCPAGVYLARYVYRITLVIRPLLAVVTTQFYEFSLVKTRCQPY